jgi:LysM repeat protein/ABC-type branched-subunit amino acid transport system substrate-binding protein
MRIKFLSIFILFNFFAANSFSQDIKKSNVFQTIDGVEYYIHTVQKKESVWKIAQAYDVSTDLIISLNPGSDKKIKPGQKLKIPVKKSDIKTDNKQQTETFEYKIQKGDNLSMIAKKFSVTVESIYKVNPGLTEKIKPDQLIRIPGRSSGNISSTTDSLTLNSASENYDCSKAKLLDSYNIALMIPFYLGSIYQIKTDDPDIKEKDAGDFISMTYIQFYEGMLMALDSLKKQGFSAKVYVYDVDDDTVALQSILQKPEFSTMHLIIGPFFENSFKMVSKFAKKNNIRLVDPISTDSDILKGNPNVFNASPSIDMQLKQLASYIVGRYPASPIIIVHNNKENEKEYLNVFETALNTELKKIGKKDSSYFKVVYNQSGISGITKNFSSTDTNIVVTLSNGEVFVTNYVSNFNKICDDYKMIVFGLPSWKNFDNIETEYLQNINLHMFSSTFVDYTDDQVKKFVLQYRDQYKTEPDKYAFQGFDVGMFFFTALKNFGLNFDKCIDKVGGTYLQNNYKFVKVGNNDGFDNTYLNIYRYEEYHFVDVREHPKIKERDKENEKKH